jgi:hypothetical protein
VRHVYNRLLCLYPAVFRRRYGTEMSLDFAEGWAEARAVGPVAAVVFASRVAGDLVVSLVREWTRGFRIAIAAATAGVTLLLWSVALRPWAWQWDMQIGPPPRARTAPPVTETELLVLATAVLIPVLVVLVCATRLVKRPEVTHGATRTERGSRTASGKPA